MDLKSGDYVSFLCILGGAKLVTQSSFATNVADSAKVNQGSKKFGPLEDLLVSYEDEVIPPRVKKLRQATTDNNPTDVLGGSAFSSSKTQTNKAQITSTSALNASLTCAGFSVEEMSNQAENGALALNTSLSSFGALALGEEPLTVAGLCRNINGALTRIGKVSVIGEVSNFKGATSKGAFFCIKGTDETSLKKEKIAVINVSVWQSVWYSIIDREALADGVAVIVTGRVQYYEPYGRISIVAEAVELAGEGVLRRRFKELFGRLSAEGLFLNERKKTLPESFKRIALMTARQGQAVRDVLNSITRQDPFMEVYLFPCLVQGRDAPASLISTLETVNSYPVAFDAVLVVRGGGSFEDLDCFNDERWIRYIAAYNKIPLISGVGHEGDHTLTEYVADHGAITPTAAAEFVARPMYNRIQRFKNMASELQGYIKKGYEQARQMRDELQRRLTILNPNKQIEHKEALLKSWQEQLDNSLALELMQREQHLKDLKAKLADYSPKVLISQREEQLKAALSRFDQALEVTFNAQTQKLGAVERRFQTFAVTQEHQLKKSMADLEAVKERMEGAVNMALQGAEKRLAATCQLLDAKSPLKVLAKGYTYTKVTATQGIAEPHKLKVGDHITTLFAGGLQVESTVTKVGSKVGLSDAPNQNEAPKEAPNLNCDLK